MASQPRMLYSRAREALFSSGGALLDAGNALAIHAANRSFVGYVGRPRLHMFSNELLQIAQEGENPS